VAGLKLAHGGSIPPFLVLTFSNLDKGGLLECVVGWRAAVESFYVSCC